MISTLGTWWVPFAGRNHSGSVNQNFLWQHENVYVMDNHRAALWCWLREVAANEVVDLLHIDEHTDTLSSRLDEWLEALPELRGLTIDQYLAIPLDTGYGSIELVRWDTYLSLGLARYAANFHQCVFATHGNGDRPRWERLATSQPDKLPSGIPAWLEDSERRWIVNVDLDYFFCDQGHGRALMFSDEYIHSVFAEIAKARAAGRLACLTICLTPDEGYTGGWPQAEALCARACEILGIPFALPASA